MRATHVWFYSRGIFLSTTHEVLIHVRIIMKGSSFITDLTHNRCMVTGRPKGYYRFFGLSRHVLREMAHDGVLPGVTKSSW